MCPKPRFSPATVPFYKECHASQPQFTTTCHHRLLSRGLRGFVEVARAFWFLAYSPSMFVVGQDKPNLRGKGAGRLVWK